jgi:hypothetical protein
MHIYAPAMALKQLLVRSAMLRQVIVLLNFVVLMLSMVQ